MTRRVVWFSVWLLCLGMLPGSAFGRDRHRSEQALARAERAPAQRSAARPSRRRTVVLPEPPATRLTPPALLTAPSTPRAPEVDFLTRRQRRLGRIAPRSSLFWIDASGGAAYLRARRLNFDHGIVQSNTLASAFRLGAGLRVEFITLGGFVTHARFRDAPLSTSGIEFGLRVPLGRIEPSLRALFGYAWEGGPGRRSQAEIRGFALGGSLGLAWFLQRHLSMELGFDASIIAIAAHSLELEAVDQATVDEARRKLERTSLARLSTLRLGFSGHL
jgi:hypothetical protein